MPSGYTNFDILQEKKKYLVTDNLRLVDHVIQKGLGISSKDPYYDDYQSEGRYGLVKAAIAFDESRGVKFATFACQYISGYVKRLRREFVHSAVRTPRAVLDTYYKVMKLSEKGLDYDAISKELGISVNEICMAVNSYGTTSLDQIVSDIDNDSITIGDTLGFEDSGFSEIDEDNKVFKAIEEVALQLSDRNRNIWYDYVYPLYFGEEVTQKELSDKYSISRSYVSRIINNCKKKFARALEYESGVD